MTTPSRPRVILAVAIALVLLLGACGKDDPTTDAGPDGTSPAAERAAVEKTIRDALDAENTKDPKAFVALWTDKGLESYDQGSRADLLAGKAEDFGSDPVSVTTFNEVKVTGTTATATLDAKRRENQNVEPLFRATFTLVQQGGKWLLDGFEFKGGPPPARAEQVVTIKAQEYGYAVDPTDLPTNVAFTFTNGGKEQHELTMFKAPGPVAIGDAKKALENVDGSKLADLPAGYTADHISFVDVGQTQTVTFAKAIPTGTYVIACFIPQGGFGENGPVNPQGKPHIQLGMLSVLTVK